eukprot:751133-Hanusia_phi.AAC.4
MLPCLLLAFGCDLDEDSISTNKNRTKQALSLHVNYSRTHPFLNVVIATVEPYLPTPLFPSIS